MLVLDPDLSKDYLDRIQHRSKQRGYTFDYAFGPGSVNLVCMSPSPLRSFLGYFMEILSNEQVYSLLRDAECKS